MPEVSDNHINGNSSRLFLNTVLGCSSSCVYCYLPSLGFPLGKESLESSEVKARDLFSALTVDTRVVWGPEGTIFSIGCFSECWDKRNLPQTVELIKFLLPSGNRLQLATKRAIKQSQISPILNAPGWRGQLIVYISSATISNWKEFEPGTSPPANRFYSFEVCNSLGIRAALYIKPVIRGISIKDRTAYAGVMSRYQIPAVVGDYFDANTIGKPSPISNSLFIVEDGETYAMRNYLQNHGRVVANSVDLFN